jgi:hypothetical protein
MLASDHFTNNIWVNNAVVYNGIYGILPEEKKNMLKILNTTLKVLKETDYEIVDATTLYERGMITSL